ncbi:MAG: Gfo/Idh/MocA family oxidoreductase [Clostridiales bacterium]|nr:Gfo/Idh/MocA family oxidoreductase [Clostridiales bacterium]
MKKVKWGIIGAGGIADRRTMPGMELAENAEIYAVMEIDMTVAESLKDKYNAVKAYDNEINLLEDPEVEAVYIASPVVHHKRQAMLAADAGKHILLEKPIALTVEEGQEVIDYCKEKGVLLATGFMMRYHAYHQAMKELVDAGKLGQIVSCRAQLTCWYPDIPGNWRQAKATSGGGALMDMGVHCLDLIQYITGSKTKRAAGMASTLTFDYEVEDSGSMLIELENGALCQIESHFNIPDAAAKGRFEIYGTKGSMLAEGTISQVEGGQLEVMISDDSLEYDAQQDRNDVEPMKVEVKFGNMYTKEIESFSNSILNGSPVEVPAEDAVQVQKVIQSAYHTNETETYERF